MNELIWEVLQYVANPRDRSRDRIVPLTAGGTEAGAREWIASRYAGVRPFLLARPMRSPGHETEEEQAQYAAWVAWCSEHEPPPWQPES